MLNILSQVLSQGFSKLFSAVLTFPISQNKAMSQREKANQRCKFRVEREVINVAFVPGVLLTGAWCLWWTDTAHTVVHMEFAAE